MNSRLLLKPSEVNPPFSPLVKAPLKDPPMRISPSCRSSMAKSRTGMGCRYTWKQLLSLRVTGRVRTSSSEKRNTCSLWSSTVTERETSKRHEQRAATVTARRSIHSYRAALVPQLAVTQKCLTLIYEGVPLLIVQKLQFVNVILALRLPLSHVDIGQDLLDYSDLDNKKLS